MLLVHCKSRKDDDRYNIINRTGLLVSLESPGGNSSVSNISSFKDFCVQFLALKMSFKKDSLLRNPKDF